ncbi:MAG: carboxypeptidase regulatory-like domain-containing protein [Acidobacteria bacterium]|nr:carboxypeptidase regulatory-like domain-containing protein [Acidobacteriota bacterium]
MKSLKSRVARRRFAAPLAVVLGLLILTGLVLSRYPAAAARWTGDAAILPGPENSLPETEIAPVRTGRTAELRPVGEFSAPALLDYHATGGSLLVASGRPATVELFSKNGRAGFFKFADGKPADEIKSLAAVRDEKSAFGPGEVFLGGEKGVILRVSAAGEAVSRIVLPRVKADVDGLVVDRAGAFGGALLAATADGRIWRVGPTEKARLLLDLNTPVKGLAVVPNDLERYGALAGRLVAGAPAERGIFVVDERGGASFFPLDVEPRDIDLIEPDANLFAVSTEKNRLYEFGAENFAAAAGDLLVTAGEANRFGILHFDGANFRVSSVELDEKIDQTAFAPLDFDQNATGCVTALSPPENAFQWEGETGSFDVAAPAGCAWTATSAAGWLQILSGQSGTGNGTVRYFVTKNGTNALRDAAITVDTLTHRVRQSRRAEMPCRPTADAGNQNVGAAGGAGSISISGRPDCAWRAQTDAPWLTLTGPIYGNGNGTVNFTTATNFTAATRVARVSFAAGTATVTQAPNLAPTVNAGTDQSIDLPGTATLSATVTDDGIGDPPTVSWSRVSGASSVIFGTASNPSTTAIFNKEGTYVLRVTATDGYLTATDDVTVTVNPDPLPPPPDPATTAPPLDRTVVTNIAKSTEFLYTGPNPIQTGVDPDDIKPERVGLLSGRVLDKSGQPVSNVRVAILDHAELGQTRSRADGRFDLVVNGGGELTLRFEKQGYITAQREEKIDWQESTMLDDVVLVPFDGNVSFIDLTSPAPIQTAAGGLVTDADGSRRARLFFKQGTAATVTLPDNSTQPLTALHVRATEFTVGANGPATMPAALPSTSEYTYASEYSVDEAVALDATNVSFSRPVIQYLENYLGFPTGAAVPTGSYDRVTAEWRAEASGRVVKVLSVTGGLADLDLTGGGTPATPAEYAALDIDSAERQRLAEIYAPGQTLWRVPLDHFTPWDCNYPPANRPPPDVAPPFVEEKPKKDCEEEDGCTQEIQSQTVEETSEINHEGYQITYDSKNEENMGIAAIPLVGPTPPPKDLENVAAIVTVAGKTVRSDLMPPSPNLTLNFAWDGKDYAGRTVQGPQTAYVKVVHLYPIGYVLTDEFGQTGSGTGSTFVRTGAGITTRDFEVEIGHLDRGQMGLGGWSLNVHHTYDPVTQTLYQGDGRERHASTVSSVVNTTAGTGVSGFGGDGGPAANASFFEPSDVAFAPDGSYYIADRLNNRIRRVDRSGIISTVAGDGTEFCDPTAACGDGGPAVAAQLSNPVGLAVAPDGSVLVADTNRHRIRRIGTDGLITTIAGTGDTCEATAACGDGGPAAAASLNQPNYIHLAPDGSLYIADRGSHRVRKLGTNGRLTTVAGSGATDCPADNQPARTACIEAPTGVALDANGSLYVTGNGQNNARLFRLDTDGLVHVLVTGDLCNGAFQRPTGSAPSICSPRAVSIGPDGSPYFAADNRIFRIAPNGSLEPMIGTLDNNYNGEGQPVTTANFSLPAAAAFAPDGNIYIAAANDHRIRRVTPTFPGFTGSDALIPSEDGTEVFQFDEDGRHLRTLNALTGTDKYVFGYDAAGRLVSITDGDGNVTTIERDGAGKPTGIRSPYNELTSFTLDANGYLASVTNAAGETNSYTYTAGGLMLTKRDPLNHQNTFAYDAEGRLVSNQNAAGGTHTFSRTGNSLDHTVTYRTPLNRASTFRVRNLTNGDEQQTVTFADGTVYHGTTAADGSTSETQTDGSTWQTTPGPDPRWGMQSPLIAGLDATTPNGLHFNAAFTRTATLNTPGNPLSLNTQTDVSNIDGRVYTNVFTAANRTFTLTSPENRQSTRVIDGQERLTQSRFADLEADSFTYDPRGRLSAATFGDGAQSRRFELTYNPAGLPASVTDPLNRTNAFVYDAAGRLTQRTLPDNRTVGFGYNADGELTSLTPPGRPAHTFGYNQLDLISSYTAPSVGGGSTTTFEYNPDRELSRITRPDSLTLNYVYDAGGKLQSLTVPGGVYNLAYDPATGLLSSIAAPGGEIVTYQIDGFLPTRESWTGTVSGSVSQTYDNGFLVTSQSIDDAHTVGFTYDNDDLPTGAGNLSLARNAANGLLTGTTLGATTDDFAYNGFGETTHYSAKFNATVLFDAGFVYDKLGRVRQKTETVGGVTTTYDYGYDPAGRLTTVTLNGGPLPFVTYGYDANDNRTSIDLGGNVTNGTYDAQDRLTQYGPNVYAYTPNGELQSKTAGGQTTAYDYDVLGNLRTVTLPDTTRIDYVIDGRSRRIGKKVNGTLVKGFLYQDQLAPVAELDGANAVISRFVYATRANVPDYMIKNGVDYRLVRDLTGSVRLVIDTATGSIAQRLDYDEFGNVLTDTNPGFQPFGFAGGLYDPQTRLVRFGARDYDAETGRWTTKDPILFRNGDTNPYLYARLDPINDYDPSGYKSLASQAIGKLRPDGSPLDTLGDTGLIEIEVQIENLTETYQRINNLLYQLKKKKNPCLWDKILIALYEVEKKFLSDSIKDLKKKGNALSRGKTPNIPYPNPNGPILSTRP